MNKVSNETVYILSELKCERIHFRETLPKTYIHTEVYHVPSSICTSQEKPQNVHIECEKPMEHYATRKGTQYIYMPSFCSALMDT